MNELKIENQKIKSLKVSKGVIQVLGEIIYIEGDFEIEFKDCEDNDAE